MPFKGETVMKSDEHDEECMKNAMKCHENVMKMPHRHQSRGPRGCSGALGGRFGAPQAVQRGA